MRRSLRSTASLVDLSEDGGAGLTADRFYAALKDGQPLSRLRTRSTRSLRLVSQLADVPPVERWTETHPDWADDWRIPLTYSRTTVDKDDVVRLDEGEFLNDNIINFYLQFLQDTLKKSESSVARRVYFHNTFFYEKLRPTKGSIISFEGVKRWTAKVDLFSYDYVVVPVNERAHWWVAIICNVPKILDAALPQPEPRPQLDFDPEPESEPDITVDTKLIDVDAPARPSTRVSIDVDDSDKDNDIELVSVPARRPQRAEQEWSSPSHAEKRSESGPHGKKSSTIILDSIEVDDEPKEDRTIAATPAKKASLNIRVENGESERVQRKDKNSDTGNNEGEIINDDDGNDGNDDDEVTEIKSDMIRPGTPSAVSAKKPLRGGGRSNSKKVFIPGGKKQDPKDPRIFTLDSLGSVHTASVDHLKQWLMAEIAERKGVKPADPGRLGTTAKVIPQQENFCDCGVYLLLYIQEFVKDPDSFIEDIVLRHERQWDTSAPDMRKQLRDLILHLQKENQTAEEASSRLKKKNAAAKKTVVMEKEKSPTKRDSISVLADKADGAKMPPPPVPSSSPPTRADAAAARSTTPDSAGDGVLPHPFAGHFDADMPIPSREIDAGEEASSSPASSVMPVEVGESSPFRERSLHAFEPLP